MWYFILNLFLALVTVESLMMVGGWLGWFGGGWLVSRVRVWEEVVVGCFFCAAGCSQVPAAARSWFCALVSNLQERMDMLGGLFDMLAGWSQQCNLGHSPGLVLHPALRLLLRGWPMRMCAASHPMPWHLHAHVRRHTSLLACGRPSRRWCRTT